MEKSLIKTALWRKSITDFSKRFLKNLIYIGSFFISGPCFSQIYINEIMVNPSGSNDGSNMPNTSEWIEFYNGSSSAVNIGCWFFTDGDFAVTFPSGATIPAGGYYTVASSSGSGVAPNLNWATCGCTTNNPGSNSSLSGNQVGIFTNGAEQVLLYNSSGVLQDAIIWGGGQLTAALTLTIGAVGSCASQIVTIPSSTASYENIGTNSDGISKERDYDGSSTWQNSGTGTFGATNAIILPIELIDFNVNLQGDKVNLIWHTASEIENNYFVLEKSRNGFDFESFFTLKGAGDSKSYNSYSAIDESPFQEITYYRLKQIDLNGDFSYSQIIAIETEIGITFNLFPNPTDNGLINVTSRERTNGVIEIVDGTGRILLKDKISQDVSGIDLSKFGKGIYMVIMHSSGKSISKKVIYN